MMKPGFHHGDNLGSRNAKGTRERQNRFQRWLSQGTLQHRDVGAIQASIKRDGLLSLTRAGTEFPKNLAKYLFDRRPLSHEGEDADSASIRLLTVVYISAILCK